MNAKHFLKKIRNKLGSYSSSLRNVLAPRFECPVCGYVGPFADVNPPTGVRKYARCPKCGALERHRIQYLVLNQVLSRLDTPTLRILHFAPEPFFKNFFINHSGQYETADLKMRDVDYNVDLQHLPFKDHVYDFVFASHVLEHIKDDIKAISEIRRILNPKGIAVLPVPLVSIKTIEYPKPNPYEANHVRAPGLDYFDRYKAFFSKVETYSSDSFPSKHQLYIYEDRTQWPSKECPLRPSMQGKNHIDVVPVCYV